MKAWKPRAGQNTGPKVPHGASPAEPKPARCKAMFAELSNYLDEQLDDSLCGELERHLDGCGPCKVFLASLEVPVKTVMAALHRARSAGMTTIVNPAPASIFAAEPEFLCLVELSGRFEFIGWYNDFSFSAELKPDGRHMAILRKR